MKKLTALLLSLALVFTCAAILAEAEEAPAQVVTREYQFRNLTGDALSALSITDNVTGETTEFIPEGEFVMADQVLFAEFSVDASIPEEELQKRYTLSYKNRSEYSAEFKTLSFEDVLIDLLPADAVTGATPIKFNTEMIKHGRYKIINNTDQVISQVTIAENANPDNNTAIASALEPGESAFVDFTVDPANEGERALTINITFEDGSAYSFETLSIEKVSIRLTPDTITGATPFTFESIDAQ